jgi:hypothetical protein
MGGRPEAGPVWGAATGGLARDRLGVDPSCAGPQGAAGRHQRTGGLMTWRLPLAGVEREWPCHTRGRRSGMQGPVRIVKQFSRAGGNTVSTAIFNGAERFQQG